MTEITIEITDARLAALNAVARRHGVTADWLVRRWIDFLLESEIDLLSSEKDVKLTRERFRAALAAIPDVEPTEEDRLLDTPPVDLQDTPPEQLQ